MLEVSSDINHDNNNLNKHKYYSYLLEFVKGCLLFLVVQLKFISKITN